jgi:hypothetical protein
MICALDNKPEVRAEIQSLADKIGEDYATARIIYENNNGYSLDKAPNGAESKLYKDLLEYYGNETLALQAKAKTYLKPFLNWFGDWTNTEATDVSKIVDENGEPLLMHHRSDVVFDKFDESKIEAGGAFWFSDRPHDWSGDIDYICFLNAKSAYSTLNEFIKKYGENAYDDIRKYNQKIDEW